MPVRYPRLARGPDAPRLSVGSGHGALADGGRALGSGLVPLFSS